MSEPRDQNIEIRWFEQPADSSLRDAVFTLSRRESPLGWEVVKPGESRTVLRRTSGDHAEFLKWFGEDGFSIRRGSGLAVWPTPAARHVEWGEVLASHGMRVSELLAAGEVVGSKWLSQPASFIVTRSPTSAWTIQSAAAGGMLSIEQRVRLASEIWSMAHRLHARGIGRLDLRAENVLIYSPDERPVLFDLDRLVRLTVWNRRARIAKDLERVRATCSLLLDESGGSLDDPHHHRDPTD
ncbi:MAG: hypothetical protein JNK58_13570 [Phycisphaerae bacterium]|nr:hypothetical protein [Phycisphaerae bacterium]